MLASFIRVAGIFFMISMGIVARRRGILDGETTRRLARLVTHILYPCLIYSTIVRTFTLRTLLSNWSLPVGSFMLMATGFLVGDQYRFFNPPVPKSIFQIYFPATVVGNTYEIAGWYIQDRLNR